jgi:enoyl-CoA hydratase/carnithine racemase
VSLAQKKFTTLELSEVQPYILLVTLNRPDVRNALNSVMMRELRDLWQSVNTTPDSFRCIILTGKGDKAFCAGADLKERNNLDTTTWMQQHAVLEQAMLAMVACPVPIIAAVNGAAFGGGFELLLAADFSYAADTATFGFPETKLGIMPGAMGTQNLPRACGTRRAKEICFSGLPFSATQALEWNIINKICKPDALMNDVLTTATIIAANAPLATRQVKKSINASDVPLDEGYRFEIEAYNQLLPTEDRVEGVEAFNEKRQAHFKGK